MHELYVLFAAMTSSELFVWQACREVNILIAGDIQRDTVTKYGDLL